MDWSMLYFYKPYDVNLWGMVYSIEFYQFIKKGYTQLWAKQIKQNIFKSMGIYGMGFNEL